MEEGAVELFFAECFWAYEYVFAVEVGDEAAYAG